MSHAPWRATPRWSVVVEHAPPALIAVLPAASACVSVWPPLFASAPSSGFRGEPAKPQVASLARLRLPVNGPPPHWLTVLPAIRVRCSEITGLVVPKTYRPPPALEVLLAIVTLSIVSVPFWTYTPPPWSSSPSMSTVWLPLIVELRIVTVPFVT